MRLSERMTQFALFQVHGTKASPTGLRTATTEAHGVRTRAEHWVQSPNVRGVGLRARNLGALTCAVYVVSSGVVFQFK